MSEEHHNFEEEVHDIEAAVAHLETPWFRPLRFTANHTKLRDDRGPSAASYGVYNPVSARVYLGLFGADPVQGSGLPVPPNSLLILPLRVPDYLDVGINPEDLGEDTATIYVMRFKTVQTSFFGSA
jgi:hypothetical protein